MRTEFHQAQLALRQLEDIASREYFTEVMNDIEHKIDNLKNEMEMMNSGNNNTEEFEGSEE